MIQLPQWLCLILIYFAVWGLLEHVRFVWHQVRGR